MDKQTALYMAATVGITEYEAIAIFDDRADILVPIGKSKVMYSFHDNGLIIHVEVEYGNKQ